LKSSRKLVLIIDVFYVFAQIEAKNQFAFLTQTMPNF